MNMAKTRKEMQELEPIGAESRNREHQFQHPLEDGPSSEKLQDKLNNLDDPFPPKGLCSQHAENILSPYRSDKSLIKIREVEQKVTGLWESGGRAFPLDFRLRSVR
jgi:hypothetical protein